MRKNVSGQVIGAQINSKTDGSAVTTGTTTVYVTGDGGTQAAGSVGSGACTHEGQGFWTYAPAQAETNYDHVAFTFVNTAGVNATVQIFPSFPQTGDNFARLGAPAGASHAADVAAVKAETATIQAKTTNLPSDPADASDIAGSFTTVNTKLDTIDDFLDTEIAAIKSKTDNLPASPANEATLTTIAGYLDTEIAAIKAKTDNLPADPADASDVAGAFSTVNTKLDTIDDFLDTEIAAIKGVTDKVDTALVLDGAVYQFTANALELGPSGSGSGLDAAGVRAAIGLGSANLDTQLGAIDDFLDTEVAAIKAKTDNLPSDPADASDIAGSFSTVNATLSTMAAYIDTEVAAIKAKTDNLPADPADASDIASAFSGVNTKLDTIDDFLDTEIAAIKAKTDGLPADPADASDIASAFSGVNTKLDTIDDFLDTEVAAIKAKTDSLNFTVAGEVDSNTKSINGDAGAAATSAILNGANVVYRGTVTGAATTSTLVDSGLIQADADWFKGRVILFTSVIPLQASIISAFNPAADQLTFEDTTQAPTGASYCII